MTTTEQDLTSMEPCEIDGLLFPLWAERYHYAMFLVSERKHAARYSDGWDSYAAEHGREHPNARSHRETVERYQAVVDEANRKIEPLQAEFKRRGGWTRYDFVPDGHLHYYGCHTLRPTTVRLLVAAASGKDAEWIVENFAYAACTYCFPDAPVEAREAYLREEKERRAAERQAKADAKAAKAAEKNLVEPLVIQEEGSSYRNRIETVYAAKQWLKAYCEWQVWRGGHVSYPDAGAERVREALALKGIDTAPLEAKWTKAASK